MIIHLLEDKPLSSNLTTWLILLDIFCWSSICSSIHLALKVSVLPDDDFTTLWSSDQNLFTLVYCHCWYRSLMRPQFKVLLNRLLNFWEYNTAIPVASSDYILTFVYDKDWLIELFDAPINLVNTMFNSNSIELELPVTTKREWCRRIEIMSSR